MREINHEASNNLLIPSCTRYAAQHCERNYHFLALRISLASQSFKFFQSFQKLHSIVLKFTYILAITVLYFWGSPVFWPCPILSEDDPGALISHFPTYQMERNKINILKLSC